MYLLKNIIKCQHVIKILPLTNQYNNLILTSNSFVNKVDKKFYSSNVEKEKIYTGTLASQIRAVKMFSLITSGGGILAQPILIEQGSKIGGTPMVVFLCSFVGFFTFLTPVMLHWLTRKYVMDMYYDKNSNEYTATTLSFFLKKRNTTFKVEDVAVPEVPGMFMSFVIDKQGLFVDPSLFTDTNHYIKIMGYDKPMDFKLELNDNKIKDDVEKSK